ncbi:MAG TPA: M48 family metalloprotease [Gallionellaceae bacterium]|nr:M48 family metalloprotease [Gallionellaceae bacterium]
MRLFPILLLLCCMPLPARAADLPDLGDSSQAALSPQQERQIGEQSMFEIRADKSYLDDAEVNDYLNQLGYKLVANSPEPGQEFEFFAINDHDINAFALPGGFVGVNSGLILIAQSESELASVLAHEISHVTQHHLARMMAGQKIDSLAAIAAIAVAILAARSNPDVSMAAIAGVGAGSIQRQLTFTREHEQEADRIGLATLQKSGFDVRAMPTFFERLQRETRLLDNNAPSWMRTHPITSERIADIDNRVRQMPYRLVADSLDFQLVRSKLLVMDKPPQEAIAYFNDALGARKFGNPVAQRYGLTLALLRSRNLPRARQELDVLLKQPQSSAMIKTLAGQIYRAEGMSNAKLTEFYHDAVQAHPQHRALAYDYADLLIESRRYDEALKLLDDRIASYPRDARLYELQARTYAAMNKPQEEHHALAYAYVSHGDLRGAIEQLELAKQSGNDYYQLSVIDNELKQFREMAAVHTKKSSP